MKRKLIAFSMTLALVFSVLSTANAHFVEIESRNAKVASRAEWFGLQGDGTGSVITQRNSVGQGEVIFNDATKDQRLITLPISETDPITRAADLDWFGVTADANNLYMVAKVERYGGIQQNNPIELMISIDTDQVSSNNRVKLELPNTAGISVTNDAAWEYVVDTRFSKGLQGVASGSTTVYSNPGASGPVTSSACNISTCPSQLASSAVTQGSFAEITIPWTRIGGKPTGANFLRFTVTSYHTDGSNPRPEPADGANSPVIDILDRSTSRATTIATAASGRMSDGSAFDVHFDTNPAPTTPSYEPYAPLLITEFQPNPIGSDNPGPTNPVQTESEYIEVYNPNSFDVKLSDYKIGNAARRGSSKGMFRFKAATIGPKAVVVVAKKKSRFLAGWQQRHPGQTFPGTVYDLTTDMTAYTAFGSATADAFSLDNEPSTAGGTFGDQVVLLDAKDGIVDFVEYGNKPDFYAGNVPIATGGVAEGYSFERCPSLLDTNGGYDSITLPPTNTDFVVHPSVDEQTPGVACVGRNGLNMNIEKTGPLTAQPGKTARFTLSYGNIGNTPEVAGAQVTIVDTLPAGLSYASASPAPSTVNGQTLTWVLPAPAPGTAAAPILLDTTVGAALGENVPLTNTVTIASPNEPIDTDTQVNNSASWRLTTVGPAKLSLTLSGLTKTPPGKQFTLLINYKNLGGDLAEGTTISLQLPSNVTLLSSSAPGATPNFTAPKVGPNTVSWTINDAVAPNGGGTITVVGQVANNQSLIGQSRTFTVTASSASAVPGSVVSSSLLVIDQTRVYIPIIRK
jgi:uncharacterized repeat protein (TIGR01451 family)